VLHRDPEERLSALEAQLAALRDEQAVLAFGLAHDLRAPLRAIDSFAFLVEQRSGELLDDMARDHLRRVRDAGARIGRLVARLQAYLNADTAPLRRAPVDVSLLADWCVAELRDSDPAREADITIAPGLHAAADERLLKSALQELLHNAWLYTAPGAPPHIRVDGVRDGNGLRLRVEDQGLGFDPLHAGKLGQPFQRLHAADFPNGCGFGLALARRIAERHGGSLMLEGRPGRGVVATVHIPDAEDA
jgi:signal transduction histidine kinase